MKQAPADIGQPLAPARLECASAVLVAQVSNLLYRGFPTRCVLGEFPHPADWKSAIQQVGNLRYDFGTLLVAQLVG